MSSKTRRSHEVALQEEYDGLSNAIARVLFPVMICMALSVFLVHSLGDARRCETALRRGQFITMSPSSVSGGSSGREPSNVWDGVGGAIFLGIFVGAIIIFTFALFMLYKYRFIKIIFGWLFLSVSLIYFYVGGVYLFEFCRSHCIDVDWITLVLVVWNFTITGLLAIFFTVPRLVNQAYLIVMSSLMAYIFRKLPEWTTWAILVILVAWDLFAVLTPCGPLKLLVKLAQDRGDPLPALVYDTNPESVGRDAEAQPAVVFLPKEEKDAMKAQREAKRKAKREEKKLARAGAAEASVDNTDTTPEPSADTNAIKTGRRWGRKRKVADAEPDEEAPQPPSLPSGAAAPATPTVPAAESAAPAPVAKRKAIKSEGVGTLGRHLKLGLGDFVFYSILVAQASQRGAMTAFTSFVAIITGLCATLFLVIVCRKALPALPISIVLGLIFYFLTRFTIQPFVDNLLPELLFH